MRFCFHVYSFKGNVGVSQRDTKFFYEFEAVSLHSFAGTSSDLHEKLGVLAPPTFIDKSKARIDEKSTLLCHDG
jgi:hypothetical protein